MRYLYSSDFSTFCSEDDYSIFGRLNSNYNGDINDNQKDAWRDEIRIMKSVLSSYKDDDGTIIFEYNIPRLGKRIDAVLLFKNIIFCLEFKVGEDVIKEEDIDQVLDYALDLKNFHKLSWKQKIVPILIATKYKNATSVIQFSAYDDGVVNPLYSGEIGLADLLRAVINKFPDENAIEGDWLISPYSPTPTIIEAARSLYENHSVEDITRHEADGVDTDKTIERIRSIIKESKEKKEKSICFVTGVPGAGKTLVGLDVAVKQTYQDRKISFNEEGAVYLSGNGPLVAVLTEALARDDKKRNSKKNITSSRREVSVFIQMIHRYRDTMLQKLKTEENGNTAVLSGGKLEIDPKKAVKNGDAGYAEVEHVAIFDEAQRAWTHERLAQYLKRGGTYGNKTKIDNFPLSEAAFLIWSLDQREDWATIVCLVGGGQEINTGEGGIAEWIRALNEKFKDWKVYISPHLVDAEYAEGKVNELLKENENVSYDESLHLKVSLRSFRAEKLSTFVHALLTFSDNADALYAEIKDRYPIVLTRDMDTARKWLRKKVRGSEKTGVLVTKESARFKPLGVHILPSGDENAVHWFLDDKKNTRSSNYLEDAATEIQVQGLELDYTCLLWDADMRYENGEWKFYRFDGNTKWHKITPDTEGKRELQKYMLNAYRVLLTRARMGMIICVPAGNLNKNNNGFWEDSTRLPEYYDGTFEYLKSLGIPEIRYEDLL